MVWKIFVLDNEEWGFMKWKFQNFQYKFFTFRKNFSKDSTKMNKSRHYINTIDIQPLSIWSWKRKTRIYFYIFRDMAVTNKSPDSWHGSLSALYSIGPGFSSPNGSLILYSNFVSVRYTAYDVAAFLRSPYESGNSLVYIIHPPHPATKLRKNEKKHWFSEC